MTQKRSHVLMISAVFALLVLAACVFLWKVLARPLGDVWRTRQDLREGRRFPQELAEAKAQGLPTEMADLQRPMPPPGRNAAPVYVRLTLLLKTHRFSAADDETMSLRSGVSPSAAQWARIARLMHDRADMMALVHQAASRPECVFTRNWTTSDPAKIEFPELATVRQSARLLELESLLLAHQGRYEAAVRNQALGFQVARHAASDSTLISYLVGEAVDSITLVGLERIMAIAGPNVSLDGTVRSLIRQDWKPRSLSAALRTETGFDLGWIAYLRRVGPQGMDSASADSHAHTPLAAQGIDIGQWNLILDYNGVFILDQMRQAAQKADDLYPEANLALNRVDAESMGTHHPARLLASLILPSVGAAAGHRAQIQALADVARAGAAVLAQSARDGHQPERLPLTLADPYTGKPLGYRREGGHGFVIFSAGADGHFDGGKPGEYTWKPYQVAFRYPGQTPGAVMAHGQKQ